MGTRIESSNLIVLPLNIADVDSDCLHEFGKEPRVLEILALKGSKVMGFTFQLMRIRCLKICTLNLGGEYHGKPVSYYTKAKRRQN